MIRTFSVISALAIAVALSVAGCGGSSNSSAGESGGYGSPEGGSSKSASSESGDSNGGKASVGSGGGALSVANVGDVGKVLVDSEGMTLYYFEKDKRGKSACYGPCAAAWPPLTTSGAPHAMGGAMSAELGTTKRTDGTVQVTYAGWPLYTYIADTKPGEDNGTDVKAFGASWYPLHPNGEKAGE